MLPYGKQTIDQADIDAVVEILKSDWLTTGPAVDRFEKEFAQTVGSQHAVTFSSGTAALHAAVQAAGIQPGDEVIVPAITFVATANSVLYCGGIPVFADVNPLTGLMDADDVESKITEHTRAIITMDYAGQPCDYDRIHEIADGRGLMVIADACHSLGATYKESSVGSLTDFSCFSLHPVKPITTGEGGMVTTDCERWAQLLRQFRNHGITSDYRQRNQEGTHAYNMSQLGFNYRMTDLQAALGISQLKKLGQFTAQRQVLADTYRVGLENIENASPLFQYENRTHSNHLMVVQIDQEKSGVSRNEVFNCLREKGIGVNVHYIPVYQHSYYKTRLGNMDHACPKAEKFYDSILTLPLFPTMKFENVEFVLEQIRVATNSGTARPSVSHLAA